MVVPASAASTTAALTIGLRRPARYSTERLMLTHAHMDSSALLAAFRDIPRPSSRIFM
jgi:hypothetical protein